MTTTTIQHGDQGWETGSSKIDRVIHWAIDGGLVVELEVKREDWFGTPVDHVSIEVQHPRREIQNGLDVYKQSRRLTVAWAWTRSVGQTPKMYFARSSSMGGSHNLAAKELFYTIEGMIDDLPADDRVR